MCVKLITCIFLGLVVASQAQMEGFIVGGQLTPINRYPHSAFLTVHCAPSIPNLNKTVWTCGSSIVNQHILITAAHCLWPCGKDTQISSFTGNVQRFNGRWRSSDGFIVHEKYNAHNSFCDIGLIKLLVPVAFSSTIKRVAIMRKPPYEEVASLAGWGLIDEKARIHSDNLKELQQKVWRYQGCLKMLGSIPSGTICASNNRLEHFASQGDSGSGLVVRGYILIGLVSYKMPTLANNLIVYSDIGHFYEWIMFHSKRLYCHQLS